MKRIGKIHILGASGSGTSTLAKALSERGSYSHLDTDDFYWLDTNPKFTDKRPINERLNLLNKAFTNHSNWVLSGSLCGWGDPLIPNFDLVIFLKIPPEVRLERLRQREKERYGNGIEEGNYWHENYKIFMDWASKYDEGDENIRSLKLHNDWLAGLKCPVLRIEELMTLDEKVQKVLEHINYLEGSK